MHDRQLFAFIGLVIYITSIFISFIIISPKKFSNLFKLKHFLPIFFLLVVALYTIPLSLFYYSGSEPVGDISTHLSSFSGYIPIALLLCTLFNFVFSFSYRKFVMRKVYKPNSNEPKKLSTKETILIYFIFSLSLWLLYKLGREVGGIWGLILSGYRVTELFINKGQYAVGFEWIITLSLLLWGNALISQNKKKIYLYLLLLLTVSISFTIMGRRAALVIIIGSSIYLFHQLYRPIKTYKILLIGILGFFMLTFIGFLRGDSYENISSLINKIQDKNKRIDNGTSVNFYYTITSGNFAVPFETFPQLIKSFGDEYNPGFGTYSLNSATFIVPSALWANRPLPLSNWYMKEFYGVTQLNEGRQFFLLSAPYMDFGPLGVIFAGLLFALFWGFILKIGTVYSKDALAITFVALTISSILNIVSSDLLGWIVVFSKGYGLPIIVIGITRMISRTRLKLNS